MEADNVTALRVQLKQLIKVYGSAIGVLSSSAPAVPIPGGSSAQGGEAFATHIRNVRACALVELV
jgi:hypothetical protein